MAEERSPDHVERTEFKTEADRSIRWAWKDESPPCKEVGLWVESNDGDRVRVPMRLLDRLLRVARRT